MFDAFLPGSLSASLPLKKQSNMLNVAVLRAPLPQVAEQSAKTLYRRCGGIFGIAAFVISHPAQPTAERCK